MRVLTFNCGSSSLKCAVVESGTGARSFELRVENIGGASPRMIVGSTEVALSRGAQDTEALDAAYYTPLDKLHTAWRAHLSERYSIIPYLFGGTSIWVICTLAIAIGYRRKRREAKARLARMAEEEAALDALDRLLEAKLAAAEAESAAEVETWDDSSTPDGIVPVISHEGERHTLH